MSFDESLLNEASLSVADEFDWQSADGPRKVPIVPNMQPDTQNTDGFEVVSSESVTGETQTSLIQNMKRGDKLSRKGKTYSVLGITPLGEDWSRIEMEKI